MVSSTTTNMTQPNRLVLTEELRYKPKLHKVTICSTTTGNELNKDAVTALQLNMTIAALPSELETFIESSRLF